MMRKKVCITDSEFMTQMHALIDADPELAKTYQEIKAKVEKDLTEKLVEKMKMTFAASGIVPSDTKDDTPWP